MRRNISQSLRSELLIANKHSCCICGRVNVQIHHINSDPSDNRWSNLAVLCLEHHDKATAPKGLTVSLKPDEILIYKEKWEKICANVAHTIARSRTAFFMVDYKNAERIRQLYAQLTKAELNSVYEILKKELIEEDALRKEQGFDVSLEPNMAWSPYVQRLVEEIRKGDPHPDLFKGSPGHPYDSLYPEGPAFANPAIPLYDIWCQIMIRCLILSRRTYDIENIMSLENILDLDLAGSLITFDGKFRGRIENPKYYKSTSVCYTILRIKSDNEIWLTRLGIKTHYVYSFTASDNLSDGSGNGVLLFRSIDSVRKNANTRVVKYSCTPLIIGSGGGGTLRITS